MRRLERTRWSGLRVRYGFAKRIPSRSMSPPRPRRRASRVRRGGEHRESRTSPPPRLGGSSRHDWTTVVMEQQDGTFVARAGEGETIGVDYVEDTVLTNRLDGSETAPVNCLVTNAVYSHSGQHVLIPVGARTRDYEASTGARRDAACRGVSPLAHARWTHISAGRVQRAQPDR